MAANTVDIIMRLVDQVSGRMKNVTNALNQLNAQGQKVNSTTQALQAGLTGLSAVAVYQGIKQVAEAFYDVAQAGAEFERTMTAFQVMTQLSGQRYTEVLDSMRVASRNTVSDMQLMLSANKALSLGVADTASELGRLTEVSAALGRRTGLGQEAALERLMIGIGRMSPRILDDLGIAVNLTRLFKEETGKAASEISQEEKIQILLNKVLEDGAEIIAKYPQGLDDAASAFERMASRWDNFIQNVGRSPLFQKPISAIDQWFTTGENRQVVQDAIDSEGRDVGIDAMNEQLERLNEELKDARKNGPPFLKMFDDTFIIESQILGLEAAIRKATEAQEELNIKSEYGSSMRAAEANALAGTRQEFDAMGNAVLAKMAELTDAQEDLKLGEILGSESLQSKAVTQIDAIKTALHDLVIDYNIMAEARGLDLIDMEAAIAGEIAVEELIEVLDIFEKTKDSAFEPSEDTKAFFEQIRDGASKAAAELRDFGDASLASFQTKSIQFQVDNPSPDAAAFAAGMQAQLEAQLEIIRQTADAHSVNAEMILAEARAVDIVNKGLENYEKQQAAAQKASALQEADTVGNEILSILPRVSAAMAEVAVSGGQMSAVASAGLAPMQEQLRELGNEYNRLAAIAGLPLIDVEGLVRGAVAAEDLEGKVDLLGKAELRLKTYAEMVNGVLGVQAGAMGMVEGAVAGFRSQLLGAVVAQGAFLDTNAQWQLFNRVLSETEPQMEGIVNAGGNAEKMYIDLMAIINPTIDGVTGIGDAFKQQQKDAESLADSIESKLKSAYDSLNGVVTGELKDSLNELSKVGIGEEDFAKFGARQDVPAENARRIAAIMQEGIKDQPWLEELKTEAPQAFEEIISAANPQEAAARILQEFNKGLRPELIDFAQLKQQIKDNIETSLRLEGMGKQLTDELIAEMGTDQSQTIQKFVANALGLGFDESGMGTDSAAKLLAAMTSDDMKLKMQDAGAINAANWALGFNDTMPEHMQPFLDLLVAYVTPAVQARLAAQQANTAAK